MAKSLLVIDDSSTIREATQLALTGGEWEVITATNGAEAMEALQQQRVDLILCAVAPGEEDGYELCRRLGASAAGSGTPMMLMGGNVNATAALAVGASSTLPKPFTAEQLQQALQETLEQSDFSFDFDDVPVTVADAAAREPEPLAGEFELRPAQEPSESLELNEIEVIDLSDDDQFDDLELLDDLQPVEPADALDLGSAEDNELEDLLAGPLDAPATEDLDAVPMELTPEPPPAVAPAGQEQSARWTVDGLMLGDNEPSSGDLGGEESLTEVDWTLHGADSVDTTPLAEITPVAGQVEEATGVDEQPETAITAPAAGDEPDTDVFREILEEPDLGPIQAGTFADLELEWAQETMPTAQDTSLAEEVDAGALEERLQPAVTEPETPQASEFATPPQYAREATREDEEDGWDLELDTGTATPMPSLGAEPLPTEAPQSAEMAAGDLAARVAASAGQAVREALEKSLSAEHLAPLVAAAVERVAWEVVPQLAERLIRETIAKLQEDPPVS
ncbi:MAG: response regulator [Deferrisomatales bacterium]|nr:response regulator [Deferrisomatales bacterium]